MARLLVTGGAGFIGANFVHHWLRSHPGERVLVLDALTYAGNLSSLQSVNNWSDFRFVKGDIRNSALIEHLLQQESIDTIVHFAAESHVDKSIRGPEVFIETNVLGTHTLLAAARKAWITTGNVPHRFHHVSTDEVYGSLSLEDPAFQEHTRYAPNSPYAASKAASDHLVRAYYHTYGLQVTISNCSNNYGPYHFPEKLIPLVILNILKGNPLPIYGDGQQRRDWLHVSDHCRAIDLVLQAGTPGEAYNVGGGSELTNIELVSLLCAVGDTVLATLSHLDARFPDCPVSRGRRCDSLIRFVADRAGHDKRYAMNYDKIAAGLGYQPTVPLREGLEQTFRWYLENEWWWRAILDDTYQQWIHTQYGSTRAS